MQLNLWLLVLLSTAVGGQARPGATTSHLWGQPTTHERQSPESSMHQAGNQSEKDKRLPLLQRLQAICNIAPSPCVANTPASSSEPSAQSNLWYPLVRYRRLANGEIKVYIDLNAPLSRTPQTVDESSMEGKADATGTNTSTINGNDALSTPASKIYPLGWRVLSWPSFTGSRSAVPPPSPSSSNQSDDQSFEKIGDTLANVSQLRALLDYENKSDSTTAAIGPPSKRVSDRNIFSTSDTKHALIQGSKTGLNHATEELSSDAAHNRHEVDNNDSDSGYSINYDGSGYDTCPEN